MHLKHRFALLAVAVSTLCATLPALQVAEAQNQSYEGIEGFVDYKHRGPVLTINAFYFDASTAEAKSAGGAFSRILADAYVPNGEYGEYPIKFEFYINRELVSTQIRSTAQPGAISLTLPAGVTAPPLSYSVVATLLYPNRSFSTVINGTLNEQNSSSAGDETVTTTPTSSPK